MSEQLPLAFYRIGWNRSCLNSSNAHIKAVLILVVTPGGFSLRMPTSEQVDCLGSN